MGKHRRSSGSGAKNSADKRKRKSNKNPEDEFFSQQNQDVREPYINIWEQEPRNAVEEARMKFYGALRGALLAKSGGFSSSPPRDTGESSSEPSLSSEDEENILTESHLNNRLKEERVQHEFTRRQDSHYLRSQGSDFRSSPRATDDQFAAQPRQSYVMKLYDRSVDLAQFDDSTPLYPICRSWIWNQPKKPWERKEEPPPMLNPRIKEETVEEDGFKMEDDEEDIQENQVEVKSIAKLPPPTHYLNNEEPNVRIPEVLPRYHDEEYSILPGEDQIDKALPSHASLMQGHLERWSVIRRSWLDAAQKNDQRFANSRKILKSMYKPATESNM